MAACSSPVNPHLGPGDAGLMELQPHPTAPQVGSIPQVSSIPGHSYRDVSWLEQQPPHAAPLVTSVREPSCRKTRLAATEHAADAPPFPPHTEHVRGVRNVVMEEYPAPANLFTENLQQA